MALLKFLKGNYATLNSAVITEGQVLICGDTGEMFVDVASDKRVKIGDFTVISNITALEALDATSVPTSRLYYVEDGNILARSNGTTWVQVNKQPTIAELKTQLGLGNLAYLSEVSESNLSAELAEKVNAASEGNHAHLNKGVLDGITAEKVTAWDSAEGNAKTYADGLNTTMNGRVEALETAIGENGSVSTQIQTAIEALDFTDTAVDGEYVSAINEVDGKISVTRKALPDYSNTYDAKGAAATALDNAKAYADGLAANYDAKGTAAGVKTELEAEIAKKVTAVEGKDLISTSEITRLASVTNYDDTQVKADIAKKADAEAMTAALDEKVDKVEGYSLVSDTEIARLANVGNYDDTTVKADIAKKADSATMTTELGKKVDKVEGYSLVSDAEITRLADVDNYDDAEVRGLIGDNADAISALADKVGTVPDGQTVMGIITNIQENAYDDTEIRGLISDNTDAIAAEKERAEGIEGGLRTDVDAIKGDYLKGSDKTELEGKIQSNADAISLLTNGASTEEIDGVNDLINYVKEHGTEVTGMKADIAANTKAVEDEASRADAAEKALAGRLDTLEAIDHEAYKGYADQAETDAIASAKSYTDTEIAKDRARLDTLEAIDHNAYVAADTTLKTELQAEIDADVKALADGQVTTNKNDIASIMEMLTWGTFGE